MTASDGHHRSPRRRVDGAVAVCYTGVTGDQQSDLRHHGGRDKAILAYSADHADAWQREIPEPHGWYATPGAFGENLTIAEMSEEDVCLGDIYDIGSCRVEVSQPRQPCWKLAKRWQIPNLTRHVERSGRTGWYLRVVQEGMIEAGDLVILVDRLHPEWSVAVAHRVMYARPRNAAHDQELAKCPALSVAWQDHLRSRSATD